MAHTSAAVVVPIYRNEIAPEEEISFTQLRFFLAGFDKYVICPQSLSFELQGFVTKHFDDRYFENIASYSRLLLTSDFYRSFDDYSYILIYQPDCLALSDRLDIWCDLNYDYIGAPLFRSKADPLQGFSRAGNGGLSLRRVESFLRVLTSRRYIEEPVSFWREFKFSKLPDVADMPSIWRLIKKLRVLRHARWGVQWYTAQYTLNEDLFWSDRATLFYPNFKIAPVDVALRFAFERFPRYCFEQNNHELPFGCHAWAKWDREFWEPYLLK